MTTAKTTPAAKAKSSTASPSKSAQPKSVAEEAKAHLDTVKDAVPSMSDVQDYVRDHADVDIQKLADDAAAFVRRNPGTSLAAAAGVGILLGLLVTKRS